MRLEEITGLVKTFPGMPGAALKLLALLDDPGVTVPQIEGILRQDAGLTANLLKLANSAYFGIPSKVGSVRQAVILLGLKRLIQMARNGLVWFEKRSGVPHKDRAGQSRHTLCPAYRRRQRTTACPSRLEPAIQKHVPNQSCG